MTLDYVCNVLLWHGIPSADGLPLWIAQQPLPSVTGVNYTTVRVDPTEWAAPLVDGQPKRTDGMIVYEKVTR